MQSIDSNPNTRWRARQRNKLVTRPASYQMRCAAWARECFSKAPPRKMPPWEVKFLLDAVDLFHATGGSKQDALMIVEYVFDHASGDAAEEVGDVMISLANLCTSLRIDLSVAAEAQLKWVQDNIERIRSVGGAKFSASDISSQNSAAL